MQESHNRKLFDGHQIILEVYMKNGLKKMVHFWNKQFLAWHLTPTIFINKEVNKKKSIQWDTSTLSLKW